MNPVKVSVIMCTYNGAKYLREQMDSILNQTYPLYEFLIYDDASTDSSFDILEEYKASHQFISIHRNDKNIGYSQNFKKALLAAHGDVISISDQDDVWRADKIELLIKNWPKESPLIYCDSARFSGALPTNAKPNPSYKRFEGTDPRKIFLFNTVSGHALLLRKEFLALVFPFPDTIYYDWWMAVVAAYNGGVKYLPETLVFQRIHEDNVTGNRLDHTIKSHRNTYKREVITHLKEFKKAKNIPLSDKHFIEDFIKALEHSLTKKFHFPLFKMMVRHSNLLFDHKNKKGKLLRNLKYAYKLTRNYG